MSFKKRLAAIFASVVLTGGAAAACGQNNITTGEPGEQCPIFIGVEPETCALIPAAVGEDKIDPAVCAALILINPANERFYEQQDECLANQAGGNSGPQF